MISILIVEDHELTRQSLTYGLNKPAHFSVIGEAEDGQEAVSLVTANKPTLVLMDLGLPVLNGIEATRQIKATHPTTKVIILTSHKDRVKVFDAFAAGADAYCMKNIETDRLIQVIEMVNTGAVWMDPEIAGFVLEMLPMLNARNATPTDTHASDSSKALTKNEGQDILTEREKEILGAIGKGLSNKAIAEQFNLSVFTVKNHVSHIIQKLSLTDRTQAAIFAIKHDLT